MAKMGIASLGPALRAAMLSGEDTSALRAEIDAAERVRRDEVAALARVEEELKAAANAEFNGKRAGEPKRRQPGVRGEEKSLATILLAVRFQGPD